MVNEKEEALFEKFSKECPWQDNNGNCSGQTYDATYSYYDSSGSNSCDIYYESCLHTMCAPWHFLKSLFKNFAEFTEMGD